jgi:acyl-CoA thioester hydrolase
MANEHPEREQASYYPFWIDESVRFHDMDAYSHVNNNVLGVYFETARMAWLEEVHPHGWQTDAHFVLAKNTILFLRELTYPNKVRIGQRILNIGRTSMNSCGGVFVGETCMALCETVSVWIGNTSRRPEPVPDSIRQKLSRFG